MTKVAFCFTLADSSEDRTVLSHQYLYIDVQEEIDSITNYVTAINMKRSLEELMKKQHCKTCMESVYRKIHEEGIKHDIYIPLVSEMRMDGESIDARERNRKKKKDIVKNITEMVRS